MQTDHVDRILQQWQHERPELALFPLRVGE